MSNISRVGQVKQFFQEAGNKISQKVENSSLGRSIETPPTRESIKRELNNVKIILQNTFKRSKTTQSEKQGIANSAKPEAQFSEKLKNQAAKIKEAIKNFFQGLGDKFKFAGAKATGLTRQATVSDLSDEPSAKGTSHLKTESKEVSIEKYQNIIKIAMDNPKEAAQLLSKAEISSSNEIKQVVKGIMEQIKDPEIQAELVKELASIEINEHSVDSPGSLLRGNSVGSEALKQFIDQNITPQFRESEAINHLMNEIPKDPLITHNKELKSEEVTPENQKMAEELTDKFLESCKDLFSNDTKEMKLLREISQHVRTEGNNKFKDSEDPEIGTKAALNFAILRFVSAQIAAPKSNFGTDNVYEGSQQKNATLISKIAQNVANKTNFGLKEPHMEPFNSFVEDRFGSINDALFKEPS